MQTCLVLDEFSVVRKIATRILTMTGYGAHSAETPADALAVMNSAGRIDIAIVSATLPGHSVEDAIRQLRSHPAGADTVFLASLVEANLGLMTRAKRAGAKGFVYRPFDRDSLTHWLSVYAPRPRATSVKAALDEAAAGPTL